LKVNLQEQEYMSNLWF